MNEREKAKLRVNLIGTAKMLLAQLHDVIPDEPLSEYKGDGAESEGMIINSNQNIVDVSRKEDRVTTIAECLRSLEKIDEDSYGECDECDEPIAPGRLKIYPYSHLCTQCKSDQEKAEKHLRIVSDQGPRSCLSVKTLRNRLHDRIAHA